MTAPVLARHASPGRRDGLLPAVVGSPLPQPAAAARAAAGAAAAVARHRLCRVARWRCWSRASSVDEFSGHGEREFTLATYAELLRPANLDIILRTRADGGRRDARRRRSSPFRSPIMRRAMPRAATQGALLSRGDDAAVVELSGQDLCLEADPRQGGHRHLARRAHAGLGAASRCRPGAPGDRRAVALDQLSRHVPGVHLCLAALS